MIYFKGYVMEENFILFSLTFLRARIFEISSISDKILFYQ